MADWGSKVDEEWKRIDSFGRDDLLLIAKVAAIHTPFERTRRRPLTSLSYMDKHRVGSPHMRYERFLAITNRLKELLALVRRGNSSCRSLAERLGVSEQTVYRDILFLKREGHPIHSVRLSNRWAYRLSKADDHQPQGARRA